MGFIYVFFFEYQLLILWGYVGTTLGVYGYHFRGIYGCICSSLRYPSVYPYRQLKDNLLVPLPRVYTYRQLIDNLLGLLPRVYTYGQLIDNLLVPLPRVYTYRQLISNMLVGHYLGFTPIDS